MVSRQKQMMIKRVAAGDAAVDGLLSGLGAGLVMAAYLVVVGLLRSEGPGVMLARFSAGAAISPWMGLLSHLAVSAMYGVVFGLLSRWILRRWSRTSAGWIAGLLYGTLLFLVAELVILPGTGSPLSAIPPLHFAIAHLLYGLVLGSLTYQGLKL